MPATIRLSQRVRNILPSPTGAMDARSKQLQREGVDIVNFSVGEPDFDTPQHVKEAARKAIDAGFTKYTATPGTPDLREAICRKLKVENGLEYTPDQIVVSSGAKQSLYNAFMAICEVGDEVILQAPYWVSYPEIIKLAGGVPVVIHTEETTGFKMTADMIREKLTPRTKIINLNSPSNPTGSVYTRQELEEIAALAVERDLWLVSDEIYEKLLYDGAEHHSPAAFSPEVKRRTITINGMSKAYAMTGWRIGYAAAEKEVAKAMGDLQGHCTSGASSISQAASVAALLGDQAVVEMMRQEFDKRRHYVWGRLRAMPGVTCWKANGAFYLFPNVSALFGRTIRGRRINSSDDLGQLILEEGKVAVVPGSGFGAPAYLRISYATSMERLQTGLDRIEALLREAT